MVAVTWAAALLRRRHGRILGAAAGVALAVSVLGTLGAFLTKARRQMTSHAIRQVAVDWQVEVQPGASAPNVLAALRRRPDVRVALPVGFGPASGFEATTGQTTQTTGPGVVLGLTPDYGTLFPGEVRPLTGTNTGVLLAQQTAANLHAGPGDTVTITRDGLPAVQVQVAGVVDLPEADSLFQRVGAPAGAQPQAPPDNVVVLPIDAWHRLFDAVARAADLARIQEHVRLDHHLPADPAAAFNRTAGAARRFEADAVGTALVGNNLAATLDAARSDALYAEVLFILLGAPAAILAGLLTQAVVAASRDSRRRELALLRTRGASLPQLQLVAATEAAAVGVVGTGLGLLLAGAIGWLAFDSPPFGATGASALTWALAVVVGLSVTVAAVGLPAWRDATASSVAAARRVVGRTTLPAALRYGLDLGLLAAAALVFWATSRGGYKLVLAPEGVPTVTLNYWALAGPLLLWAGSGLLAWRVVDGILGHGGRMLRAAVRPFSSGLVGPIVSVLRRQRRSLATGVVLVCLAVAFAISTAVFNTTYRQQVRVDALLTNGAPVTVTEAPGGGVAPAAADRLRGVGGVGHVESLQHRFVYVGADLQDLYGIDPASMGAFGSLQDTYVAGGTARGLLQRLKREPDAALVSAETVRDFQLRPGDPLRLRIRDAASGHLTDVSFRYAGIVKEFPTAPTDSFVVANAAYVAGQTGDASVATLLVSTRNASAGAVARRLRAVVGPGTRVSSIDETRRVVGSSLTAVDLGGLTRVELTFALLLVAGATGLVLALGLGERRRTLAIASALGARPRQVAAFARAEAAVFALLGGSLGIAAGWTLAYMLVKVLTGVFDPAPAALAVPWRYLGTVAIFGGVSLLAAVAIQLRASRRPPAEVVRDL